MEFAASGPPVKHRRSRVPDRDDCADQAGRYTGPAMLWIVLVLLAFAVAGILYQANLSPEERALMRQDRERRQRKRQRAAAPEPAERDDVMAQIARDPVHTLARLGTPEDAERLMAQGIDLEALGYRPPHKD